MEEFKGSKFLDISIPGSFLLGLLGIRKGLNNQMSHLGA